jgi:hypothetical protein
MGAFRPLRMSARKEQFPAGGAALPRRCWSRWLGVAFEFWPPGMRRGFRWSWLAAVTAIASVSGCACRGSRQLPRSAALPTRRRCCMESATLRRGDGCGRRRGIAVDVPRLPRLWLRPLRQSAPPARGRCCHTTPALPANLHLPQGSRQPEASRLLKQARPDFLPRDDFGRILLMAGDAVVKLRPLRIRQ